MEQEGRRMFVIRVHDAAMLSAVGPVVELVFPQTFRVPDHGFENWCVPRYLFPDKVAKLEAISSAFASE